MSDHPATIEALLAEIHRKGTVLRGWTAALSLSEAAVHSLAESQWAAPPKLALAWAESVEPGDGERRASVVHVEIHLGAPRFALAGGENAVSIRHPARAATLKRGTLKVVGPATAAGLRCDPDDPRAVWSEPAPLSLARGACVEGSAPLAVVPHGTAPNTRVVALDLDAARFGHRGLGAPDAVQAALSARLGPALCAGQSPLHLAALDLGPGATRSALRPTSLKLNVAQAKSGARALQLLIGGPEGEPAETSVALDEPVPIASGSDYSLVIDSKVVIKDIVSDFNVEPGLVKLAAVDPASTEDAGAAWYAQTRNPMQFQGSISCGDVFAPIQNNATLGMAFKGSQAEGLVLSSYADSGGNIALQLAVAGNFPVTVSGSGPDQRVSLSSGPTSVAASGVAENAVKAQLQAFLGSDISRDMGKVSFDTATQLLLKRLSLPGKLPRILHAQIPGDLALAGSLEPKPAE